MADSVRRRNGKVPTPQTIPSRGGVRPWVAAVLGVVVIIGLAAAASFAQATPEVFIAASLLFSVCEGVVLTIVGYTWSGRGLPAAVLAATITAALAAPGRWEVAIMRFGRPPQAPDLLADLLLSLVWGALAGLAGGTVLRPKLAALMQDAQQRFPKRPPR